MIHSIFTVRAGLIARIESHGTLEEAQEAAGISRVSD
jgi:hypothetical protein